MKEDLRTTSRAFTLIELLIVIAIVLIMLAGEATVLRHAVRSTSVARDLEVACSILASDLAELKARGIRLDEQPKTEDLSPLPEGNVLPEAERSLTVLPKGVHGLLEVQATLTWKSVTGKRSLSLCTLLRVVEAGP
ncbi:MAG: type II secretion system protein [Candidatus Omnitrophica bacterium]|nr:type II secretion system protein [Candidatus Omnitrophota bacterium]